VKAFLLGIIQRYPETGYIGAIVPTGVGFWVWVDKLTKLGALASIAIGIAVGLATWRVQRLQARRLESERNLSGKD
jgi:Na+/proline symporter